MNRPIVVGFDGSDHGRDALALGRAMALALDTRLIVVNAYTPEEWIWAPGTADPLSAEERKSVAAVVEAELSADDRYELRSMGWPSAAGALHSVAEADGAQLIVVGSTHRGAVGSVLLGTVTQQALDAAPCSVLVAPTELAANRPVPLTRVGVGFDDTPQAHEALAVAASLARRVGGELRIIWAAHLSARALPDAFAGYLRPNYFDEVRADVEQRLERAVAPLRGELSVRSEIASGATVAALTESSRHLDLLVLGSRGYGPVKRVLLGSVSRAVIKDARCPVLSVARGITTLDDDVSTGNESSTAGTSP